MPRRFLAAFFLFAASDAAASLAIGATGGIRTLSSQAVEGGYAFVPETGIRLTFADESFIAPEATYAYTRASFGGIRVEEHAIQLGARVADDRQGTWQPAILAGLGFFVTHVGDASLPDHGSMLATLYGGAAMSAVFGALFARADVTDNISFSLKDSVVVMNFSLGLRW